MNEEIKPTSSITEVSAIKSQLRQNLYYVLIGAISLIVLVFFPMFGSELGIGFDFPDTPAGWCIYVITKVLVMMLNLLIFFSFNQQGKLNIKDHPKYLKALELIGQLTGKEYVPRSPKQYSKDIWSKKGLTLMVTTIAGLFALTSAILSYDYMSLITYGITIATGLIFGCVQMLNAEEYWTEEFYNYALKAVKEQKNDNN